MTTKALKALLAARNRRLRNNKPWNQLTPAERAAEEQSIKDAAEADAAIVAYLRSRHDAVVLGDVILHLTADRAHFVELDARTGLLAYPHNQDPEPGPVLYRYPPKGIAS